MSQQQTTVNMTWYQMHISTVNTNERFYSATTTRASMKPDDLQKTWKFYLNTGWNKFNDVLHHIFESNSYLN